MLNRTCTFPIFTVLKYPSLHSLNNIFHTFINISKIKLNFQHNNKFLLPSTTPSTPYLLFFTRFQFNFRENLDRACRALNSSAKVSLLPLSIPPSLSLSPSAKQRDTGPHETSRVTRFSGKFHSSTLPLGLHAMALSRSSADLVQTRRLWYTATL